MGFWNLDARVTLVLMAHPVCVSWVSMSSMVPAGRAEQSGVSAYLEQAARACPLRMASPVRVRVWRGSGQDLAPGRVRLGNQLVDPVSTETGDSCSMTPGVGTATRVGTPSTRGRHSALPNDPSVPCPGTAGGINELEQSCTTLHTGKAVQVRLVKPEWESWRISGITGTSVQVGPLAEPSHRRQSMHNVHDTTIA